MKFKATETVHIRASPSLAGAKMGAPIPAGTIVESDEYTWKRVALPDGRIGFSAGEYFTPVISAPTVWRTPLRYDKFKVTQAFLAPDAVTYPKTGHHPGVDYGTQGEDGVPLYFCADGEIIERGVHASFGNYFFYYVSTVDRTFVYFHLRDSAPAKGTYTAGAPCGIVGKTGLAFGIHLHLECMRGRKTSADRSALYTSKATLMTAAEDADTFIRARL